MKKYKVVKITSYSKAFRLRYHKIGSYVYVYRDFEKYYFVNGKRHRRGGPAVETRHYKQWWVNDKLHRLDGPAFEKADGPDHWYINDNFISTKDINEWMEENNLTIPFDEPTQMLFLMKFG